MWVKRVLYVVALIVSGALGFVAAKGQVAVLDTLDVVQRDYDTSLSKVDLSGIRVNSDDNIVNVLLVGNDYRKENGYSAAGLTDTMLIATLDMKHGTLKLTTLMRDMLVEIPDHGSNKLNSANSFGGIELLYKTIAQNFNIQLDGYVEVSFDAFKTIVNDVGGVEIELTESEAAYLNATNYIRPAKYRNVKAGKHTLNGAQALGYCRIRKYAKGIQPVTPTGQIDDYGRTWRQRNAITSIFNKVKKMPMSKWLDIAKDVLKKNVKTDLTNKQIINYIKDVVMMGTTTIHQLQIPVNPYFSEMFRVLAPVFLSRRSIRQMPLTSLFLSIMVKTESSSILRPVMSVVTPTAVRPFLRLRHNNTDHEYTNMRQYQKEIQRSFLHGFPF